MTDIAKCAGTDCPLKETCYRYLSKDAGDFQSWFLPVAVGENCGEYWPAPSRSVARQWDIQHGE